MIAFVTYFSLFVTLCQVEKNLIILCYNLRHICYFSRSQIWGDLSKQQWERTRTKKVKLVAFSPAEDLGQVRGYPVNLSSMPSVCAKCMITFCPRIIFIQLYVRMLTLAQRVSNAACVSTSITPSHKLTVCEFPVKVSLQFKHNRLRVQEHIRTCKQANAL